MHRFRIALAVLCLAALVGCSGPNRADRAAFDAGYASFEAGRWQQAVDQFTQYLRSDPSSPTRGEVYYYRGEALVHLKKFAEAKADFLRAIGAEARPPIDSFARVAIANLYYEEGSDARAVEQYVVVLRDPPDELPLPMVLLRVGVSLQRLGRWQTADRYLDYLVRRYPATPAGQEAARRVRAEAFTVQTGAFASRTTASRQASRVRAAGFPVRISQVRKGTRVLNTVQAGQARTYAEAAALAGRIRQAGFETLIVP